jgi:DNA polymerase I
MKNWHDFHRRMWAVDYEFYGGSGGPQVPICYVARNIETGEEIRHWLAGDEAGPLYPIDESSLFIAFYSSAEFGCHIPLKFGMPTYVCDLYTEFKCLTNGLKVPNGYGLLGACLYCGIPGTTAMEKDLWRSRILEGPPFSQKEQKDILEYCANDVRMTVSLFKKIRPYINLSQALLRGAYPKAVAWMEHWGVPVDVASLEKLKFDWELLKLKLIEKVDVKYLCYQGTTFKIEKFKEYLAREKIPWEYTETGLPRTDEYFFKDQAKAYPQLRELTELRHILGALKLNALQIGPDHRNRALLSQFRAKTSRNQPSSAKFIFGPSTWLRGMIKPEPGQAIAYIDYSQQEIAIAGALSRDLNLIAAYESGDPYLAFAKRAGAVPSEGTKETHGDLRDRYKQLMLAVNYGMGAQTFAMKAGISLVEARALMKAHKFLFRKYWDWNTSFCDFGKLTGRVRTRGGWQLCTADAELRTLMNWPMQAHGAEILRLAICLCIQEGIRVIAPVHDALLIEASVDQIDAQTEKAIRLMGDASEYVVNFRIRAEAKIVRFPDRYMDKRGAEMWETIWDIQQGITDSERGQFQMSQLGPLMSLDHWEDEPQASDGLSRSQRAKKRLQPQDMTERNLAKKLRDTSGLSHVEVMHLIRKSRDSDYDLEHEVDWDQGYEAAKDKIAKDTDPTKKKTMKELHELEG